MSVVVNLFSSLLTKALAMGASDIHIEPYPNNYRVRFRIDGLLTQEPPLSGSLGEQLISCIKVHSQLDIAERRRPQDGTFTFEQNAHLCDVRVATFPSLYGEKLVMRLLDQKQQIRGLDHLGLPFEHRELLEKNMSQEGFFLVTGPTGSGKTTTVHALLLALATPEKNCITLEDPIEYRVPGITQTQIHPEIGLTFESGLRSLLRQDPDIIMVGEIRDQPTAAVAIQAALTGHRVLSTLHASSALGALTRLQTLGVNRSLIAAAVKVVVSQRLLRKLCVACKQTAQPTLEQKALLSLHYKPLNQLSHASGCSACYGKGYRGRIGIFQVLEVTKPIRELVISGASEDDLFSCAQKQGMETLFMDASLKLEAGILSFDEWYTTMHIDPLINSLSRTKKNEYRLSIVENQDQKEG